MSETEAWTVGRLLTWTTDYLKQHGASTPRLDAEVLLAQARGCQRIELYTAFRDEVDDDVRGTFRDLVRRRAAGEPVAYLVGYREFYSLSFEVTPDVLIPRPETEHVVVRLLDLIRDRGGDQRPVRMVDVGTGSGAIAVAVARHAPDCHVTAVDVSDAALDLAKRNASRHEVADRMDFLPSDLLAALPREPAFDFVVSNPPYVSRREWEELAVDVRDHEPRLALVAGDTGTEVIQRLIPEAADRLVPGGWLLMEISPMIESSVCDLLEGDSRFEASLVTKDLAGLPRVVESRRSEGKG
jgi:release factor glutamine methyltransferase